jgi:hypothetical protein
MSEIIQIVAYSNYDGFPHLSSKISQKIISLFYGLSNDKNNPKVKYAQISTYSFYCSS